MRKKGERYFILSKFPLRLQGAKAALGPLSNIYNSQI